MPLLTVLWSLGVLVAVAVSYLWSNATVNRLAHNSSLVAVDDMRVEAAVNRAVLEIIDPGSAPWRADGTPNEVEFSATRMKVSIQDQVGLVDINQVDARTLTNLFASAGVDRKAALELTERVVSWRRPVQKLALHDQEIAKPGMRPRHGPFQSVGELKMVVGVTPDVFGRIKDAITVYSGRPFVDPNVAPQEVLKLLSGNFSDMSRAILGDRAGGQRQGLNGARPEGGGTYVGRAFSIRTTLAKGGDSDRYVVTVRMTDDASRPFWVLNWSRE